MARWVNGGVPPTITITSIFQDEPVFFPRDGGGVGTNVALVRAERLPRRWFAGDGRVYTIGFRADGIGGGSCQGEVMVEVPLRRGIEAINGGPIFDSTIPGFGF